MFPWIKSLRCKQRRVGDLLMDIPPYIKNPDQENYHQELNQTLRDGLSDKGVTIPQVTNAQLVTNTILDPATGLQVLLKDYMPDGTQWYVTDGAPATGVMKVAGALRRISTTAYP